MYVLFKMYGKNLNKMYFVQSFICRLQEMNYDSTKITETLITTFLFNFMDCKMKICFDNTFIYFS